jgi:hypothetical protein
VLVSPNETNGGRGRDRRRRNKGGGKGEGRLTFLAQFHRLGTPDKTLNISKDRLKNEWTCGNGVLIRSDSDKEHVVWKSSGGFTSTWTRTPPDGPVYFDLPPAPTAIGDGQEDWSQDQEGWMHSHGGVQMHPGGPVYFNTQAEPMEMHPQGEWKGLHLPGDDDDVQVQEADPGSVEATNVSAPASKEPLAWNPSAPEFVPTALAAPAVAPATPIQAPAPAPQGPTGAQAIACQLQLAEESPDVQITGNSLEWVLKDNWAKLNRFQETFV